MSLRFASLGSGSSGNATIIALGQQAVLVDCGFSVKETEARLNALKFSPSQLVGLLLTHEHGDHAKGVRALSRKYSIPLFTSKGTAIALGIDQFEHFHSVSSEQGFEVGRFQILPVTVPHDAREPLQFVVEAEGLKVGVLTDLGSYTPAVISTFSGCDALLVEANHDLELLARGPYPMSLQRRVSGAWGHLNNRQTCELLQHLDLSRVQQVVVGHISQKNNTLDCVQQALSEFMRSELNISFATQDKGFDWLELSALQAR